MENTADTVQIFCDGSCSVDRNKSHVGVGVVVTFRDETFFIKKGFKSSACSFFGEVLAVLFALKFVKFKYGNKLPIQLNIDQIDLVNRINDGYFDLSKVSLKRNAKYKRRLVEELKTMCRGLDVIASHCRYSNHVYSRKVHCMAYSSMKKSEQSQ